MGGGVSQYINPALGEYFVKRYTNLVAVWEGPKLAQTGPAGSD
jgi:hypothetical protein